MSMSFDELFQLRETNDQRINNVYIPNTSKLESGKVYRNYAELVEDMGWKKFKSGSNGEKAQQKALSTVCSWRRDIDENGNKLSNKIIIEEVYQQIKPTKDKRKVNDKNYLTRLVSRRILEVIEENQRLNKAEYHGFQNKLYLTLGSLYAQVGLVNSYYMEGRNNQNELSNELNCPIEHVNDFYNCVSANLKKTVQKAFDRLYNQRLVYATNTKRLILRDVDCNSETVVEAVNIEGEPITAEILTESIYATERQKQLIFKCERTILAKYGLFNFSDVYTREVGFRRKFFKDVVECIKEVVKHEKDVELSMLSRLEYYYNVVELAYCEQFVQDEVKRLGQMTEEERNVLKGCVDQSIIEEYLSLGSVDAKADINQEHLNRLTQNAKQRHQKALKTSSDRGERYQRTSADYSTNMDRIAEKVIEQKND